MERIKIIAKKTIHNGSNEIINDLNGLFALDGYMEETIEVEDSNDLGAIERGLIKLGLNDEEWKIEIKALE